MDFAEWAGRISQLTNGSLAGSRVYVEESLSPEERELLSLQMAEWGLTPERQRAAADWVYPELPSTLTPGAPAAIARAKAGMPVTERLATELADSHVLEGMRIGVSLIVEPKTAVLLECLRHAGATVGVYCHAHECDQVVADELIERDYLVEANASWSPAEERAGALRLLDRLHPQLLIDDGANISRLLVMERPALLAGFLGVAEETTSGIRAFEAMQDAGELPFRVVDVNDSALKSAFDNRHGTGETCITTCQALLGWHVFAGEHVCVFGFGPVGEGFARRARSLGASVSVIDHDPRAALRAAFAGFETPKPDAALAACDLVVSATGVRHTLSIEQLSLLKEGACVCVIGGIANEVAFDQLSGSGGRLETSTVPGISQLVLPDGKTLRLLAAGDGVNYAAGPGNPIQIMDLSFAVQLLAVERLVTSDGPHRIIRLGDQADRHIADIALAVRGRPALDDAAPAVGDWRRTRFADTAEVSAEVSGNPIEASAEPSDKHGAGGGKVSHD